jgi:hypothetical protein
MQAPTHELNSSAPAPSAATLTPWYVALFLICVLALHAIRSDLDPSSHMLSEYALGSGGWIMVVAFLSLSLTFVTLLVALRKHLAGTWGVLAMLALAAAAIGSAMGGIFPMDPLPTPPEQYSLSGKLHGVAFMLGAPGVLLATLFVGLALKRQAGWKAARNRIIWSAALVWTIQIMFAVAMVQLLSGDGGAENLVGWLNRALVASWLVWAITLARAATDVAGGSERQSLPI